MSIVKFSSVGNDKYSVKSPYNPKFNKKIKPLGAEWNRSISVWIIPSNKLEYAKEIAKDFWGTDGEDAETTCLLVKDFSKTKVRDGIFLFDIPVAHAFGRDSGAKWGDYIVCLKGDCKSDGSYKNWETCVIDATFKIPDLPFSFVNREDVKDAINEGWCAVDKSAKSKDEIEDLIQLYQSRIDSLKEELSKYS